MPSLGQVITNIRSDLNRGTDFDARIQEAIANAIAAYRGTRYPFNTGRQPVFATASEYNSLSFNFIEIDTVVLQVGTSLRPLRERSSEWITEAQRDQAAASEPIYYAIQDRQLRFYPRPNRTYSVEISAHLDLTGISLSTSDSASSNAWLVEGYDLIKLHAMVEVLEMYIKGDDAYKQASILRSREINEIEPALKRVATRQQSSGHIKGCM